MYRPALLVAALALAGCTPPAVLRYYTLNATAAAPAGNPSPTAAAAVLVGPVLLPAALDRPQLVVRAPGNRVAIIEDYRWAEPLKRRLPRVIADNLARLLPGASVFALGEDAGREAGLRVLVDIRSLDAIPGEALVLEALWSVRRAAGEQLAAGRTALREPATGAGYEPVIAAHERALARLAEDIAAALAKRGAQPQSR